MGLYIEKSDLTPEMRELAESMNVGKGRELISSILSDYDDFCYLTLELKEKKAESLRANKKVEEA